MTYIYYVYYITFFSDYTHNYTHIMYKKLLYFLSILQYSMQENDTDTMAAVIQTEYNEHNYIMSQVIINKDFDSSIMTKTGDWSDNFYGEYEEKKVQWVTIKPSGVM